MLLYFAFPFGTLLHFGTLLLFAVRIVFDLIRDMFFLEAMSFNRPGVGVAFLGLDCLPRPRAGGPTEHGEG